MRTWLALGAVLAGIAGFMLTGQIQKGATEVKLSSEREEDLVSLLAQTTRENDRLRQEIGRLQLVLAEAAGTREQQAAAIRQAEEELENLKVLMGLVPVAGPGVVLDIDDPGGHIPPELMVELLHELRGAGAEAIEISGVRAGTTTWFARAPGGLSVEGKVVTPPYRVLAVGDPSLLEQALKLRGGVMDALNAAPGVHATLTPSDRVEIRSVRGKPEFRYARPRR